MAPDPYLQAGSGSEQKSSGSARLTPMSYWSPEEPVWAGQPAEHEVFLHLHDGPPLPNHRRQLGRHHTQTGTEGGKQDICRTTNNLSISLQ